MPTMANGQHHDPELAKEFWAIVTQEDPPADDQLPATSLKKYWRRRILRRVLVVLAVLAVYALLGGWLLWWSRS